MDQYLYLAHHGIKGQKWGVRRYQNPDVTLTDAGKARVAKYEATASKYETKAAKYRAKESLYEYKRDRARAAWFPTDISEGSANQYDRKRARQNIKALKAESLSRKYDAKAKELISKAKNDKVRYDEKRAKELEAAVDDFVEAMNGNISPDEFNKKHQGAGYKIS